MTICKDRKPEADVEIDASSSTDEALKGSSNLIEGLWFDRFFYDR